MINHRALFSKGICALKSTLFFSLSICLVFLNGCSPKSTNQNTLEGSGVALFDPSKLKVIADGLKLSLESRLETLQSLEAAMKRSYFGFTLKKELIGVSGEEIFDNCKKTENTFAAPSFAHDFNDRLRQCLAQFKDGHLNLRKVQRSHFLVSPISSAALLRGEFVIVKIRPKILSALIAEGKLPATSEALIKPGVKIAKINGKDPQESVAELYKYISESTDLKTKSTAIGHLFDRNFSYPDSAEVVFELQTEDGTLSTLSIPWLSYGGKDGLESPLILEEKKIYPARSSDKDLVDDAGPDLLSNVYTDLNSKMVYKFDGNEVATHGYVDIAGQVACYYSLKTFDLESNDDGVFNVRSGESDVNLVEVTKAFFDTCVGKTLILDLHNNGGGALRLQAKINTLLERSFTMPVYAANAYRYDSGMNGFFAMNLKYADKDPESIVMGNVLFNSIQKNQPITPWILQKNKNLIHSDFDGKIIGIISEHCVSACENFVHRLSLNKNAVLVGAPTAGTGYGFASLNGTTTNWYDPMNSFTLDIPNDAFGTIADVIPEYLESNNTYTAGSVEFSTFPVMENIPTKPNIEYTFQKEDLDNFTGYKKSIEKVFLEINNQELP